MYVSALLTPHKISLLLLVDILSKHSASAATDQDDEDDRTVPADFDAFRQFLHMHYQGTQAAEPRLAVYVVLELVKECKDAYEDPSLGQLLASLDAVELNGVPLSALLMTRYAEINSLEDLLSLIENLKHLFDNDIAGQDIPVNDRLHLDRTSVLGIFVRHCIMEFDRQPFHRISKLWAAFHGYTTRFSESLKAYHVSGLTPSRRKRDLEDFMESKDGSSMEDGEPRSPTRGALEDSLVVSEVSEVSEVQEVLLDASFRDEDGEILGGDSMDPDSNQRSMSELLKCLDTSSPFDGPSNKVSESFEGGSFARDVVGRYVNAKIKEIEEGLHGGDKDLQRALSIARKMDPAIPRTHHLAYASSIANSEYETTFENIRRYFETSSNSGEQTLQASLSLAMGHLKLNQPGEAMEALKEAIAIAKTRQDRVSLTYALSLLNHAKAVVLENETTNGIQQSNRDTPAALARSLEWIAASSAELELRYLQSIAELGRGRHAFQTVRGGSSISVFESLRKSRALNVQFELEGVIGANHLLSSTVWESYGSRFLASLDARWQIKLLDKETTPSDISMGFCKIALLEASMGSYSKSVQILELGLNRFPLHKSPVSIHLVRCLGIVLFQQALNRDEWKTCEVLCDKLASLCIDDPQMRLEATFCRALLFERTGLDLDARELVSKLLELTSLSNSTVTHARGTYLVKQIDLLIAGSPMSALMPIMRCLDYARRHHLRGVRNATLIRLADVFVSMRLFQRGLRTIEKAKADVVAFGPQSSFRPTSVNGLPSIPSSMGLRDQGEFYLVHGRCLVGWTVERTERASRKCAKEAEEEEMLKDLEPLVDDEVLKSLESLDDEDDDDVEIFEDDSESDGEGDDGAASSFQRALESFEKAFQIFQMLDSLLDMQRVLLDKALVYNRMAEEASDEAGCSEMKSRRDATAKLFSRFEKHRQANGAAPPRIGISDVNLWTSLVPTSPAFDGTDPT
ncbi:hypothetical protein BJ742DRAFT_735471 [Cladochytrium replicatum]|nr:hypothetical protein BJ742DRAFT_735471 [Cladochytrium replicatum]